MKLKEKDYWLGFSLCPGIGPKRFLSLKKYFGSAKKAWRASKNKLFKSTLSEALVEQFDRFRQETDLFSYKILLEKSLIRFFTIDDKEYPKNLKKIDNPPIVLYIKGGILPQDYLSIAVVGTRNVTCYGREVTERLVRGLVMSGLTIVSGLARGIDSIAHRLALGNGGRTIAVLGGGLDKIYPPEHKALAEKIVQNKQGALVSEFPVGMDSLPGNFPARNRVISGLSLGVLVTEGASKSGTKITAQQAQKQGRLVFAVPGPITSQMSEGPADLIKMGARLVTKADDVIKELGITGSDHPRITPVTEKLATEERKIHFENKEEEKIWQVLSDGLRHIDEIVRETGLASAKVSSCLTIMEVKGIIRNFGEGNYGKRG